MGSLVKLGGTIPPFEELDFLRVANNLAALGYKVESLNLQAAFFEGSAMFIHCFFEDKCFDFYLEEFEKIYDMEFLDEKDFRCKHYNERLKRWREKNGK